MALNTEGRVVLKIYDSKKSLMIARPCESEVAAKEWAQDYIDRQTDDECKGYRYDIVAMVPRI